RVLKEQADLLGELTHLGLVDRHAVHGYPSQILARVHVGDEPVHAPEQRGLSATALSREDCDGPLLYLQVELLDGPLLSIDVTEREVLDTEQGGQFYHWVRGPIGRCADGPSGR